MSAAVLDAAGISAIARQLYTEGPPAMRAMQHWRAYICPLDLVIERIPSGAFVLDVGCGGGLLLGVMAHAGRIRGGVGIDVGGQAIDCARAMARRLPDDVELRFEQQSAAAEWPRGPFSVVTLVDVLHHVPVSEQRGVLRKAAAAVAPGGLLVFKDMAMRPFWRRWANTLHDLVIARQWVSYVPMAEVCRWCTEDGLRPMHVSRVNRLWYGHELTVFRRPDAPSG